MITVIIGNFVNVVDGSAAGCLFREEYMRKEEKTSDKNIIHSIEILEEKQYKSLNIDIRRKERYNKEKNVTRKEAKTQT